MVKKKWLFLFIVLLFITGCDVIQPVTVPDIEVGSEDISEQERVFVHFIDVGQGDCIFIKAPQGNMVIDAGENETEQRVVDYIKNQGVTTLNYVVATHPHSDHIGGLDAVVNNFEVNNILMPKATNNTTTFRKLVEAVSNKGLKATEPVVGEKFNLGDVEFTILAPSAKTYENLNNYSIGLKMIYNEHSFIFTADAEKLSEREMLNTGIDLKADFMKLGHHGSYTSNSKEFLEAISPKIAIISLGLNNDYGHPHKEVMKLINERKIQYYRTDEVGDIVIETDGVSYEIIHGNDTAVPEVTEETQESEEQGYEMFVDENGQGTIKGNINSKGEKIYHMPGNANYERTMAEEYFKTEQEALDAGYRGAKK